MRTLGTRVWGVCLVVAVAMIAVTSAKLDRGESRTDSWDLLYLPNGRYLAVASLGQRQVLADFIYLWAIQYYGHYDISNRYEHLDRIFREVITELDPRYFDPYWIGALIMTTETKDLERALALLDKGFVANPDQWLLPYLAGWECYHARRLDLAAGYFEKAIRVPGAPAVIRRAYAAMYEKKGDRAVSIAAWAAIESDPSVDERGHQIARRHLDSLRVEQDIETLQQAIARYAAKHGANPGSLEALVRDGALPSVPVDSDGRPYGYDRRTGKVAPASTHVLEAR